MKIKDQIALVKSITEINMEIEKWITAMDMEAFLDKYPAQLSGGELKRASILLALVKCPKCLILDEPTASLDEKNREIVIRVLKEYVQEGNSEYCESKDFIYMQYNDIQPIAKQLSLSPSGISLFTSDVDDYVKLHDSISKLPVTVNDSFTNLKSINKLYQNMKWIKIGTVILIILVCMSLLTLLQVNYFYKRNREFSLLIINGLKKKELITLTLLETLVKIVISFIIFSVLSFIMLLIFYDKYGNILMNNIGALAFIGVLNITIIFFIVMVYLSYYLKRLIPENILRS